MSALLVIDTAQSRPIVGIAAADQLVAVAGSAGGPDSLRVLLQDVLRKSGRAAAQLPPELAAIAVGTGPGRYTGLRGGIAFAKGLAAARLPVVGVPAVAALSQAAAARPTAVLIPAGRGRFYLARSDTPQDVDTVELDDARRILPPDFPVIGDLTAGDMESLRAQGLRPQVVAPERLVGAVARLARRLLDHGDGPARWTAVPSYVNSPTSAQPIGETPRA